MKIRNVWTAFLLTARVVRLWVRHRLPWETKGYLREEADCLQDQLKHATDGINTFCGRLKVEIERNGARTIELNDATEELQAERAARLKLEGQRLQEHAAVRQLAFGLSNGLEATLVLVNQFIEQSPDYTPDQSDRAEVMEGLVKQQVDIA